MTATASPHFVAPGPPPGLPPDARPAAFTTVATAVVRGRGLGLSPWAKLLYVALRSYAAPDGTCFPGYGTLQADVGCGINQLTRAMRELEAAGLLTRRRRGQGKPTLYTVHAPGSPSSDRPQFHAGSESRVTAGSESRVTAGVKQDSPPGGAKQDSGDLDPEGHHQLASSTTDDNDHAGAGDDVLIASLTEHGVTERIAMRLLETHRTEAVWEQLAWHPYRPAAKNPAGALVQAIRERWPAPAAWLEAQEHAAAVARQAEEDAARRAEDEARRREWEARPPEERVAGRLQFWLLGRQAKGREPTPAEFATKRAELLAELAGVAPAPIGRATNR